MMNVLQKPPRPGSGFRSLRPIEAGRFRLPVRWHVLLMPLVFIPIVSYWIVGPAYLSDLRVFVLASLLNFSLTGACVLTLDTLTRRVIRQYSRLDQSAARVARTFLVFFVVTPLFLLLGIYLYSHFHLFGYQHTPGLTAQILLCNVGVNVFSTGIDETVYSLRQWRENALEREELQKANLQSQYESLKHQVNPHFLFNSLNSLSSLIADEPEQAERFVDEMARVYRYLLQTNHARPDQGGELTTLADELQFIESYFHLLRTRYRTGIDLTLDVPQACMGYRLPPLTLQMLVENAVKHNVIMPARPLRLSILAVPGEPAGRLLVQNNLQRKTGRASERLATSNGIGLANIATKYHLLSRTQSVSTDAELTEPIIRDDDGYFTVLLPLFPPVSYERTDC